MVLPVEVKHIYSGKGGDTRLVAGKKNHRRIKSQLRKGGKSKSTKGAKKCVINGSAS